VEILWTTNPLQDAGTGPVLLGDEGELSIARAVLELPPGKHLYVSSPVTGKVLADFGARADIRSRGGLPVAASMISSDSENVSEARRLACGAAKSGSLAWPGIAGDLKIGSCQRTIQVVGMNIGDPLSFELSGPAFTADDGGIYYWPLLKGIASNLVLQTAVTLMVGAFLAWVTMRLRHESD
jgi:hypothetical protein